MKVHFATNRDVREEGASGATLGQRFNEEGPQFFRVGAADVALKAGQSPKDDDCWNVDARLYSERDENSGELVRGSQAMFEHLRVQLKNENQDVLVFVHGFASTFESSINRAASLQMLYNHGQDDKPDPLVFAFSWPSNGRVFTAAEYFRDRDDAQMSGIAMARSLMSLIDFMAGLFRDDREKIRDARTRGEVPSPEALRMCGQRLHLIAHSMGNWALRHAVLALSRYLGRRPLPRLFNNAFLIAADEDADALGDEAKLGLLFELAHSVHVYHSGGDRALHISDITKFNPNRLGTDGPSNLGDLPPRIYALDCSAVDDTTFSHGNHQYYRIRDEVIADIKDIIAGVSPNTIETARREVIQTGRSWKLKPLLKV